MRVLDMEEQRQITKAKRDEWQRLKAIEEEKLAKKKK